MGINKGWEYPTLILKHPANVIATVLLDLCRHLGEMKLSLSSHGQSPSLLTGAIFCICFFKIACALFSAGRLGVSRRAARLLQCLLILNRIVTIMCGPKSSDFILWSIWPPTSSPRLKQKMRILRRTAVRPVPYSTAVLYLCFIVFRTVIAATAGSALGVRSEFGMVATEDNLIYVFGGKGVAGYYEAYEQHLWYPCCDHKIWVIYEMRAYNRILSVSWNQVFNKVNVCNRFTQ